VSYTSSSQVSLDPVVSSRHRKSVWRRRRASSDVEAAFTDMASGRGARSVVCLGASEPDVWDTCHRLADAVKRWWTDVDAIVYRSRTTPETSVNFAFFADDGFDVESWTLGDRMDVLTDLVLYHGFTIGWDIGAA